VADLDVKHCTIEFSSNDEWVCVKNHFSFIMLKWNGSELQQVKNITIDHL